jgi:hypothetical protein
VCPVPGHPCLSTVPPEDLVSAVGQLVRQQTQPGMAVSR